MVVCIVLTILIVLQRTYIDLQGLQRAILRFSRYLRRAHLAELTLAAKAHCDKIYLFIHLNCFNYQWNGNSDTSYLL